MAIREWEEKNWSGEANKRQQFNEMHQSTIFTQVFSSFCCCCWYWRWFLACNLYKNGSYVIASEIIFALFKKFPIASKSQVAIMPESISFLQLLSLFKIVRNFVKFFQVQWPNVLLLEEHSLLTMYELEKQRKQR